MNYVLDTNIVSLIGTNEKINDNLSKLKNSDNVYVSILTIYEAQFGLENTNDLVKKKEIKANIVLIKKYFDIIPLDLKEAEFYPQLKVKYKNYTGINRNSVKKNDIDLLIASSAISKNAILVSNDKIFETLAKLDTSLKCENWTS